MFTSISPDYAMPKWLYKELDKEFHFTDDPCPLNSKKKDGLIRRWKGDAVYINPPYGREIFEWIKKGFGEWNHYNKTIVMLLPARTDTRWWHNYVLEATEIRFIRGRLKFNDGEGSAPFPSCIVIFKRGDNGDLLLPSINAGVSEGAN